MSRGPFAVVILVVLILAATLSGCGTEPVPEPPGVFVSAVEPGEAAARAGLSPGEEIVAWIENGTGRAVDTPFTLARLEACRREEAPPLVVRGTDGTERRVQLAAGDWGLELETTGQTPADLAWRELSRAAAEADAGQTLAALDQAQRAVRRVDQAGDPELAVLVRQRAAFALARQGDAAPALEWLAEAVARRRQLGPEIALARLVTRQLGVLTHYRRLDAAAPVAEEAVAAWERLAPSSFGHAVALRHRAIYHALRGEYEKARDGFTAAREILQERSPKSLEYAGVLYNLALVAALFGQLDEAESLHREAFDLRRDLAPYGLDVAASHAGLARVARLRGDLAAAEEHLRRTVEAYRREKPESLDVAGWLLNLGNVALERRDLAAAAAYYRESRERYEKLAPDSSLLARVFHMEGMLELERAEKDSAALERAETLLRHALDLRRAQSPASAAVADTLTNLGKLELLRQRPEAALEVLGEALEARRRIHPDSLYEAGTRHEIGEAQLALGDLAAARASFEKVLEIVRRAAPGSALEAAAHDGLARVHLRRGESAAAGGAFERAVQALEAQSGRLGGSDESRAGFLAAHARIYRDYLALLVAAGEPAAAFQLLERYRARALLALLGERQLALGRDLGPELAAERRAVQGDYRAAREALEKAAARDVPRDEIERLRAVLERRRAARDRFHERLRRDAPRLAALEAPQPLDAAAARRELPPGTLLLSYAVGESESWLFSLERAGPLEIHRLEAGETELASQVEALAWLLRSPSGGVAARRGLEERAAALYEILLAPVEERLATAKHLLVIPDGPLHHLPFAVLRDASGRYLVERLPLHRVVSATVYAELRRPRSSVDGSSLVLAAFGDPLYGPGFPARTRDAFAPLPATRDEVQSLVELFPGARSYLGAAATEAEVRQLPARLRYLHFACHGRADALAPLDSYLALTPGAPAPASPSVPPASASTASTADGLLQAWEIFEDLRVDADLVTLSACDTAVGPVLGGEGLIGLVRAFYYAGARSVLASSWSVGDRSTALLMTRFYAHLESGLGKAAALRAAQLEFLRGEVEADDDLSHPHYWAAFQLMGGG